MLNKEIAVKTRLMDPLKQLPSTPGVENWLRIHGEDKTTSYLHVPPIKRGFPIFPEWDEKNEVDFQLLPLLNRYCYRCHSGLKYNVFDKYTVTKLAGDMISRIKTVDEFQMPLDRRLSDEQQKELIDLLEKLGK